MITADYIVNDHFAARVALFSVQPPPTLTLPLQVQSGVLQVNGLVLSLAPAAASTLNSIFGGPVVQAGTNIGTANVYVVLSPSN